MPALSRGPTLSSPARNIWPPPPCLTLLLLWGDLLLRLERPAEGRRAYALAVDRDRESQSARFAAERLRSSPACPEGCT